MDVLGAVQLPADGEQLLGVGGAADLPDGVGVGGLHADLKLKQPRTNGGKKVDHLLVDQVGGQLEVEVGHAVVVRGKVAPDGHRVLFGAVEGAVDKFDLRHPGVQKPLQALEGKLQRQIAHPTRHRGEAVAAPEGTSANRLKVEDAVLQLLQVGIGKGQLFHRQRVGGGIADNLFPIPPDQRVNLWEGALAVLILQVFQKGNLPLTVKDAV